MIWNINNFLAVPGKNTKCPIEWLPEVGRMAFTMATRYGFDFYFNYLCITSITQTKRHLMYRKFCVQLVN